MRVSSTQVLDLANLLLSQRDPRARFAARPEDAPYVHALVEALCECFSYELEVLRAELDTLREWRP